MEAKDTEEKEKEEEAEEDEDEAPKKTKKQEESKSKPTNPLKRPAAAPLVKKKAGGLAASLNKINKS